MVYRETNQAYSQVEEIWTVYHDEDGEEKVDPIAVFCKLVQRQVCQHQ